jgi:hypothetical protein
LIHYLTTTEYGDPKLNGFFVIQGGVETKRGSDMTAKGVGERNFGFCSQRCKIKKEDIGPYTQFQLNQIDDAQQQKRGTYFKNFDGKLYTYSRMDFKRPVSCTMTADYLRFLIKERGLSHFRLLHFIQYEFRNYLTSFIDNLLQKRYDLQQLIKAGLAKPGAQLQRAVYKLLVRTHLTLCTPYVPHMLITSFLSCRQIASMASLLSKVSTIRRPGSCLHLI